MKKVKTLSILISILVNFSAFSQTFNWAKSYGGSFQDIASDIAKTSDGGYIIAGYSYSNDGNVTGNQGNADYWIVKLDSSGNIQWQKTMGGSNDDKASSIQQTSNGQYIVAGYSFSNDGDVTENHGGTDYWIVKLDSLGNIIWENSYGGSEYDVPYSITETSDNGYIIAGKSTSNDGDVTGHHGSTSLYDYWIVKIDSLGNILWQKSLGGTKEDIAHSIIQTADGGSIIAGLSYSEDNDVTGQHGWGDCWIVKLDFSGNIQWQKTMGGGDIDNANSIIKTFDGGYIIAGNSRSLNGDVTENHGNSDYWIIKLDSFGNIQWQKSYGGSNMDIATSIVQISDGGYFISGYSNSNDGDVIAEHQNQNTSNYDYWIIKLDSAGNILWQKTLGGYGDDYAYSIVQTSTGGFVVAGYSDSQNNGDVTGNHGDNDYWAVKLEYNINTHISCIGTNNGSATIEWIGNTIPNYLWSNGDTTSTIDNLSTGWYYVTITTDYNSVVDSVFIAESDTISIYFNTENPTCYNYNNGSIQAYVSGGMPPYTYTWNTGQTSSFIDSLTAGVYNLTITDMNGCNATNSTTLTQPDPIQDSISYIGPSHCLNACNGTATVYAWGGTQPYSYQWSNDSISQTIQLCSDQNYKVTITDSYGCSTVDSLTFPIFYDSLQICIVTIDTTTGKCLIIWERPDNQIMNEFVIYKKTGSTTYSQVGFVNWEDLTEYLDSTSNPSAYAHSYKICMIDTCGNYTPLSYYHKTMYLSANQGTNQNEVALHWTHYEDGSGNFLPEKYYIYRKSLPSQPYYQLIDSVPGDLTDYNDIYPPAGYLSYVVLTPHSTCVPTGTNKSSAGPFKYSFSNVDNFEMQQFSSSTTVFLPVSIYPNPVTTKLIIEIYNPQGNTFNILLMDSNGKIVYNKKTKSDKLEINRKNLPSGIYEIVITGNNKVYNSKIIIK